MHSLYIVRHGQTIWNTESRIQGRLDSALTDIGRDQANNHGKRLADQGIDLMLVSPLGRTLETANMMNSHIQVPMHEEETLVERHCGDWSGLTLSEIETRFPDSWAERNTDAYYHRPPSDGNSSENHFDMRERVASLLESLFTRDEKCICLVTHGIMSRVILTYYLGLTPIESVTVRHPNSLYYRLQFAAESITVHRYELGEEEKEGLLQTSSDGTVMGNIVGQEKFVKKDNHAGDE